MKSGARQMPTRAGKLRLLTAAQQTMRSWARAVGSYDDVPDPYKAFFDSLLPSAGAFSYAVLTPKYEGFLRQDQEKLICWVGASLYIVQARGNRLASTVFRLPDIHYVEMGTFLLQSWLKIRGVSSAGLVTVTLKFNTVSERLFDPIVGRVRAPSPWPAGASLQAEQAKLREIDGLSLKLLNFGKNGILPGETITRAIWQPEILIEGVSLLGRRLFCTASPAHLAILTAQELILVTDNPTRDSKYGVIRTYIPLDRIHSVTLWAREDDLLVASLYLAANDGLGLLYSRDKRGEVERFVEELGRLVPGAGVLCLSGSGMDPNSSFLPHGNAGHPAQARPGN